MAKIPRKSVSYVIVSPQGEICSERRIRASSAWVNATRRRGVEMGDVESQQADIEEMQKGGYRCELKDRATRAPYASDPSVGNIQFLHMRMSKKEREDLEALKRHYSDHAHIADLSSVIRLLISEKVASIAASTAP